MTVSPQEQMLDFEHRCAHHPPSASAVGDAHDAARQTVINAGKALIALTGPGREQSTMLTKLEEALFWANADIARNQRGGA